jgi:hypothetical protein
MVVMLGTHVHVWIVMCNSGVGLSWQYMPADRKGYLICLLGLKELPHPMEDIVCILSCCITICLMCLMPFRSLWPLLYRALALLHLTAVYSAPPSIRAVFRVSQDNNFLHSI